MLHILSQHFYLKKRTGFIFLILGGFFFILFPYNLKGQEEESFKVKTVVIDPGHGGRDYGAIGKNAREKDLTLILSKKLGSYINQDFPDVKVIYTRTQDVFVPLDERAEIANKNNADLFISIHVNSHPSSKPYGTETFLIGDHKTEENLRVAQKENSSILFEKNYEEKYDGFDPNSAESYIVFSLLQSSYIKQSVNFASYVQRQFEERAKRHNRGVKRAGFLVLWKTTMPSVLIETGFLSNPREERYLMSEKGQTYLASAIFRAFRSYKENFEKQNAKLAEALKQENRSKNKDVTFQVQIASSSDSIPIDSEYFKGLNQVHVIKTQGLYKYAVGSESKYETVVKLKEEVRKDFPGAFVIALQNGRIIPLEKALKIAEN